MKRLFFVCLLSATLSMEAQTWGGIRSVQAIHVDIPKGTAPCLPSQLWVTYTNGRKEYRQVRWNEAEPQSALGSYELNGYIIGDNTTPQGYPVKAQVTVVDGSLPTPPARPVAEPLPLDKVTLCGNNRLTHNRDMDIDHLLSLDVRQQLYNYRDTYGLSTEGYPESDGWDSPTTKLKGHGSGHYMSALALAFASCTDKGKRNQLRENMRRMVNELRSCQERTFVYDKTLGRYLEARDLAPEGELINLKGSWADFETYKHNYTHYGYGYLNAIPAQHCVLIEAYRAYNNEQWVWAPYYSVHKQLAGLIDIATYVDDKAIARKAFLTAKDMGLWVWNRLHYRTYVQSEGTQEERRARPGNRYEMWNMYIAGEVGGMAESLARLSEMATDSTDRERLLEAATFFDSPAFFTPLAQGMDAIRTRHANQHIPMVTGALRTFRAGGETSYYHIARNFWSLIQGRYRYATGGVGNGEMFRQPYSQILSMCTNATTDWQTHQPVPEPTLNETCCAYNLAKLTKDLNGYDPNDARYMDYYERLLYNQIVGSLHPDSFAVLYQYALGLDASKPWGNETPQSTCCGGTGAENHVKYQEAAYYVGADTLWVGLYLPTIARWDSKGIVVRQECSWPAERSVIRVDKGKEAFVMKLRIPYWATDGFDIRLNGKSLASRYQPCSYVTLPARRWRQTDSVEIIMPYTMHLDYGPDKMTTGYTEERGMNTPFPPAWCAAIMKGPLVMCAQGIKSWEEALLTFTDEGSMVTPPYTFIPDYAANEHVTHYFRLQQAGFPLNEPGSIGQPDTTRLAEAMQTARLRRETQQAWLALQVKVPEHAPWAPYGYARLMAALDEATAMMNDEQRFQNQEAIDLLTTALETAINTMRPSNLAELEDLEPLHTLMAAAHNVQEPSAQLREAINYADMVVRYVSDGSGTKDMIDRAIRQLKACTLHEE